MSHSLEEAAAKLAECFEELNGRTIMHVQLNSWMDHRGIVEPEDQKTVLELTLKNGYSHYAYLLEEPEMAAES